MTFSVLFTSCKFNPQGQHTDYDLKIQLQSDDVIEKSISCDGVLFINDHNQLICDCNTNSYLVSDNVKNVTVVNKKYNSDINPSVMVTTELPSNENSSESSWTTEDDW